ncbi:MAG TPA: flagellar hook capping protein [Clostridiales bacterium UBA8153]|nr:flagellar hook capping protein [Clostridiales bacterium UBA8153]
MVVSGIRGGPVTAPDSRKALEEVDFLRLITTQLRYQDPMRPLDEREFLVQMAQLSSLQELRAIRTLVSGAAWQAATLVGREVELATPQGPVRGTVSAVRLGDQASLEVGGRSFGLGQLVRVSGEVGPVGRPD